MNVSGFMLRWFFLSLSLLGLWGCGSVDPMVKVSLAGTDPRAAAVPWTASSQGTMPDDENQTGGQTGGMTYKLIPVTPKVLQQLQYQWRYVKSFHQAQSMQMRLPPTKRPSAYVLGSGDELEISLAAPLASLSPSAAGQSMTRIVTRLDDQGRGSIPHVGSLPLAGKTLSQAQSQISKALASYIKSPQVFVRQTKFASKDITVSGAVAKPGLQPLTDQHLTLTQALAQAGNITAPQQRQVSILIERAGQRYVIPRSLLAQGGLRSPLYLQDRDQIRVLAADDPNDVSPAFAYIGGEVVAPQRVGRSQS